MNTRRLNGWYLLKLVYALRDMGINVSTQEIQDVLKAFRLFPNIDPKISTRSLLIHREEDIPHFNMVWKLLFDNSFNEGNIESQTETLSCSCTGNGDKSGPLGQGIGTGNGGITIYPQANSNPDHLRDESFSLPDIKTLYQLKGFPGGIDETRDLEELDFEEQVKFILGQSGFLAWSNSQELKYSRGLISEEQWRLFEEQKNGLEQRIREQLWHLRIKKNNSWDSLRTTNWRYKSLDQFTVQEEHAVYQALRQMGRKLATRPGWQTRKANRGKIRLSSALKEMLRGNGHIYNLEFEKPVLQRPELVLLCDVSNSVAPFSQFLLYLIRRIKSRFRRVRIYLFIDTLWDISNENWVEDIDSSEQITSWSNKKSSGFSDYGKVFKEYFEKYLPETSSRATLLILGDARNNYRPSQVEYLREVKEKIRRVYWLNPLLEAEWHNSDNIMNEYIPYCTKPFRCRTIDDLWQISRQIF